MAEASEVHVPRRGGHSVLTLYAPGGPRARGVVVLHGYAEHAQYYDEVCRTWAERGHPVACLDLRGHGRSDGAAHGHVARFSDYLDDLSAVLTALALRPDFGEMGPPHLIAHSMGGLVAVHAAVREGPRLASVALSSPYFKLKLRVPVYKRVFGWLFDDLWPTFSEPTALRGSMSTNDPEIAAKYDADPKLIRRATARWFAEVKRAQAAVPDLLAKLTQPCFWQVSGADQIVEGAYTKIVFERIEHGNRRLVWRPNEEHHLLTSLRRMEYAKAYADWWAELG